MKGRIDVSARQVLAAYPIRNPEAPQYTAGGEPECIRTGSDRDC